MDKLLNCPFCGGEVALGYSGSSTSAGADYQIEHRDNVPSPCIAEEMYIGSGTEDQQIARWNTRSDVPTKTL